MPTGKFDPEAEIRKANERIRKEQKKDEQPEHGGKSGDKVHDKR